MTFFRPRVAIFWSGCFLLERHSVKNKCEEMFGRSGLLNENFGRKCKMYILYFQIRDDERLSQPAKRSWSTLTRAVDPRRGCPKTKSLAWLDRSQEL